MRKNSPTLKEFAEQINEEKLQQFIELARTSNLALANLKVVPTPISQTKMTIRLPTMKKWYKSKTLWINLIFGLGSGLEAVLNRGDLSANQISALTAICAIINIVIRTITKDKLTK